MELLKFLVPTTLSIIVIVFFCLNRWLPIRRKVSVFTSKEESGLEKHEMHFVNSTGANVVVNKILLRSWWKLWGGEELDLINLVAEHSADCFGTNKVLEHAYPNYYFETKDRTCPWEGMKVIVELLK